MYRHPADRPRNRLPLLDELTVKTPCTAPWAAMSGDERARFCFACRKNVYDVNAMSEDEAEAFLALHLDDEEAGVRLYRRPDGRILVSDCPRGASKRHGRRVAVAASITASALVAVGAAAGNIRLARAHRMPQSTSRFEVPRPPVAEAPPRDYEIDPPRPVPLVPWGRDEPASDEEPDYLRGYGMVLRPGPEGRDDAFSRVSVVPVDLHGLPPEVIVRVTRYSVGQQRLCYASDLRAYPADGRVVVRLVIGADGTVTSARDAGSARPESAFARCLVESTRRVLFPRPESGGAGVTLSFAFSPVR